MTASLLNLPTNIPWCHVATTENMMDRRVGAELFPAPWRSSVSIYAYEPLQEDLPEQYAKERLTYIKVSCSITGYQPSRNEVEAGIADLDDGSADLRLIFEEYLACYGVLLNVSVFPLVSSGNSIRPAMVGGDDLSIYPHIVAMEPKTRDLYQVATESGEALTASHSGIKTDKSFASTSSSETGLAGEWGGVKASQKWGYSENDSQSLQADSSRERRETEGTSTQINQMYNLLTGYHQGTNRATFLMLPRPHVLQPSDRRTFVQGLRQIEGIQDFFLVVVRPEEVDGICIESFLETGHFSEHAKIRRPEPAYEKKLLQFDFARWVRAGYFHGRSTSLNFELVLQDIQTGGFEPDPSVNGTGIEETEYGGGDKGSVSGYSVNIHSDTFAVTGTLSAGAPHKLAWFGRTYKVHLRKQLDDPGPARTSVADLLITRRGVSVCLRSSEPCPEVLKGNALLDLGMKGDQQITEYIAYESPLRVDPNTLIDGGFREQAVKELLSELHRTLSISQKMPTRYRPDEIGFLESNYFGKELSAHLSDEVLSMRAASLERLAPDFGGLIGEVTVADLLRGRSC